MASETIHKGAHRPIPIENRLSHALPSLLLCAAIGLLGPGCATTCTTTDLPRSPQRPIRHVMPVLKNPRWFKSEYAYPADQTDQQFHWDRQGLEWHVLLPVADDAFAGIIFRRAYDFAQFGDEHWLSFQIKPAFMADHVALGLTDSVNAEAAGITLPKPLNHYLVGTSGDWGYVLIPLGEFDQAVASVGAAPLNWSKIRGLKLARETNSGPERPVTIKRIEVQSRSYFVPIRYASIRGNGI